MKTEQELIDHVTAATGVVEAEVRKVVDAAFAFVRESALGGAGLVHPSLGAIKVRERAGKEGGTKTVYRFDPSGKTGGRAKAGGGAKAGGRAKAGGGRAGAGKGGAGRGGAGKGRGPGRRAGAKPAGEGA